VIVEMVDEVRASESLVGGADPEVAHDLRRSCATEPAAMRTLWCSGRTQRPRKKTKPAITPFERPLLVVTFVA
jgi:hypothetical protein